jgi:hypothetical protein
VAKYREARDLDQEVERSLKEEGLRTIVDWIAQFSLWIPSAVYSRIQVVYPATRRKTGKNETRRQVVNGIKLWENQPARDAFWAAYGLPSRRVKNYVVCHIYEDSAHLPKHFTNLANLVVVPRSLASFTEFNPVRDVLKWHSYVCYGYRGPESAVPEKPPYYPQYWPGEAKHAEEDIESTVARLEKYRKDRPGYSGTTDGNRD